MKIQIQIKSTVCMSRTIEAKDLAEAMNIAEAMAEREQNGVKAEKGWAYEYCEKSEVVGVWK